MKKLNKNEAIALAASLFVVGYLLYGGSFLGLFNINAQNKQMTQEASGVERIDISEGQGEAVVDEGDVVTVHYVGMLVDGKVFDSSIDRNVPFSFKVGAGDVIRGWDEGLVGMKVGGKRRLVVSPDYGYGNRGIGAIPPNSTLVFDIEVLNIEKQ